MMQVLFILFSQSQLSKKIMVLRRQKITRNQKILNIIFVKTLLTYNFVLVCPTERHANINTIFITVPFQVGSITDEINPLQSGSVFYEHAKLTGALYKHITYFHWIV